MSLYSLATFFNQVPQAAPMTVSAQNLATLQDLFNRRQRTQFQEKAKRYALSADHEAALLFHICAQKPARHNNLAVLFESLLCGQTVKATQARHIGLNQVNAAIEASLAVDAVLERKSFDAKKLPAGLLGAAYAKAQDNGYDWAARAMAVHLPPPRPLRGSGIHI